MFMEDGMGELSKLPNIGKTVEDACRKFALIEFFHLSNFRPKNRWKRFVNMQVERFVQMEYTLSALSLLPGHTLKKKKRKEQKMATCIQQAAIWILNIMETSAYSTVRTRRRPVVNQA